MVTRSGERTAIALLLDASGQSDHEVSQALGIHPSLMSRYRSGSRRPSKKHADLLSAHFHCSLADLLGSDTIEGGDGWIG